ncbi:hypothetical protein L211DRAFT_839911 [Terfezia boudieri ATCC MYA-4762]|uniref:FAD-binding FR-type domain-containing protein n=1 Tax=Terfezia boudieri ATCC MYA-4762 TaxID=1051890 RepID=A0A3N4LHC0_9PEZI|nr:hypothetical protein L211DRAFT_839911 [Terfezia boudieri ATCC MYA-4762]
MATATMDDSIPEEPIGLPHVHVDAHAMTNGNKQTEKKVEQVVDAIAKLKTTTPILEIDFTQMGKRPRRASTHLVSVGNHDILSDSSATNIVTGECCGGGCCMLSAGEMEDTASSGTSTPTPPVPAPENPAFKSLRLKLQPLRSRARLVGTTAMPVQDRFIYPLEENGEVYESTCAAHPPTFVKPHPPYNVFSARLHAARQLTKEGAEKPTFHFDLDVTDYPEEIEGVDFRVGGAIGVVAPNYEETVEEIFDRLQIPEGERDVPVILKTDGGRWPTMWGEEEARTLKTTRRELLTWTVDIQSYAPTKQILRVLAEYAGDENEKTILLYLCSKQGQAAFCELRTGPHITLLQLLHAFPSSFPPFDVLLSVLPTLMPRFYSLSSDPHNSSSIHGGKRRIIEIAVTLHDEDESWKGKGAPRRQGVGSGFLRRQAQKWIKAQQEASEGGVTVDVRIPMFRGLMANPLAKEFVADGPMLLIGAGVGIAPFRGFVQRRLQNANCANKVWILQGIRDSLLDELYSGEWGVHESKIRKVVESRVGPGRYVQEEVKAQADLVWHIINSIDGRIFVCGSSKGMGEGVEQALVEVAMLKGRLSVEEAKEFWRKKSVGYQFITETW